MKERPTGDIELKGDILCCKDLRKEGTWAGLNVKSGRFVVLTNVRLTKDLDSTGFKSRGQLVQQFLHQDAERLEESEMKLYPPFNLIYGNLFHSKPKMVVISNAHHFPQHVHQPHLFQSFLTIENGDHAISNSFVNDLSWPKVDYLRSNISEILSKEELAFPFLNQELKGEEVASTKLVSELQSLLTSKPNFPAEKHPKFVSNHGPEMEHQLQKDLFVEIPSQKYQTRSQTIVLKPKNSKYIHYLFRKTETSASEAWKVFSVLTK